MNIAKVIVDVPSISINQTFDYLIPDKFLKILQPGMRVVIPFGPRKITGFVVGKAGSSEAKQLREIIEVLDLTPVLTDELLALGRWLAEETLCLYITAYQAMLPNVLKAKYEKEIVRHCEMSDLPPELATLFAHRDVIPYEAFTQSQVSYYQLQKAIEEKLVTINYLVTSKITKKYETWIKPAMDAYRLEEYYHDLPKQAKRQKQIIQFFIEHPDEIEQKRLRQLLNINRSHLKTLIEKSVLKEEKREAYRNPYAESNFETTSPLPLTPEQEQALELIQKPIRHQQHDVILLHGVTGSGKTEVYLQAIDQVIKKGQEAIVLVPEISLTPQMVRRFKGRFGSQVAVLHSALSSGEKFDEWRKVLNKEVKVVVGARSAIFAPFENLGIIIIDEEHELSYKQEDQPRYHARDVAIQRGKHHSCPVILGSATPTLESYARAKKGVYQLATLTKRTNEQALPSVQVVDMRDELHAGNRTMFSRTLQEKIVDRIEKGEQIILLLNRRGYSTFVMCRDCGHVKECPHCDIALTFHKNNQRLKCHYCSYEELMPTNCPACESDLIRYFGTGTQRVEESLKELIPQASIIRMDVDTTRRKGAHERLLNRFANQEANILLGTQMIAKGLDFPNVTLVGVLTADSILHIPDFRSGEKTFQLLTQVSGRAGRHELPGEVIIQTYTPDHYSIELASQHHYEQFFFREMQIRKTFRYPPYVFLTLITVSHPNHLKVVESIQRMTQWLKSQFSPETVILGPTPSPLSRIKNRYRYQCMIKYKHEPELKQIIQRMMQQFTDDIEKNDLQIHVDFQPYQLM